MAIDSAIFAQQKSNKICSAVAPTDTRPLRGVQSLEQGGSSASATIALEAEKARHSRQKIYFVAAEKTQRVASKAQQKQRRFIFFGALRVRGEGKPLFLLRKQAILRI